MDIAITAIGTANPIYKRKQLETAELILASLNLSPNEQKLLRSVYKATGIEYRHSVLSDYCQEPGAFTFFPNDANAPFPTTAARMNVYKEHALPLALSAVRSCFNQINPCDITHLITISCTGMYAPGLDIELINTLNLRTSTHRTAINFMGCYGAFNGIKAAYSICRADPNAKVLMICVELCTIHFQKQMCLDNMIANAIFADGAAAILIEQRKNEHQKSFDLVSFYCDLLPQNQNAMAWYIADHGFDIVLSSYVPTAIEHGIAHFVKNASVNFSATDYYAIHPGGIKILQACEKALKLDAFDNRYAYEVLKHFGNMSSATILFVLKSIWDVLTKNDHEKNIFSCAFGPGLTLESMQLRVHNVS